MGIKKIPVWVKNISKTIVKKFKPLTVHTEAIMNDNVWREIKKRVLKKKVLKWYVMTPANYLFFKTNYNIKMSKRDISQVMKSRYLWMKEKGENLQLHIHLSIIKNMNSKDQENLFAEALKWLKEEVGIVPKEFVAGWWAYNKETLSILKKYNLKLIKYGDYDDTHDYHWIL